MDDAEGEPARDPMNYEEKNRLRAAAVRARRVYPGIVGDVLSDEILTWEALGQRLGSAARVATLVDHLLRAPTA